jgi:hypothetical protein
VTGGVRVGAFVGAFEGRVRLLDLAGNLGKGIELDPAEAKLGWRKYPPLSLSVSVSVSVSSRDWDGGREMEAGRAERE